MFYKHPLLFLYWIMYFLSLHKMRDHWKTILRKARRLFWSHLSFGIYRCFLYKLLNMFSQKLCRPVQEEILPLNVRQFVLLFFFPFFFLEGGAVFFKKKTNTDYKSELTDKHDLWEWNDVKVLAFWKLNTIWHTAIAVVRL